MPELPAKVVRTEPAPHRVSKAHAAEVAKKLELLQLEDRLVPAGQITGQVFVDYNSNGLLDTSTTLPNDGSGTYNRQTDIGVGGVIVTAYDPGNVARGTATTAANGTYTLSATGTGAYRLEFTNIPNAFYAGPQATNATPPPIGSSTSVQFVPDGNSVNRNLSLSQSGGYSDNPQIVTSQYFIGDQTGTLPHTGNNGGPLGFNDYSTTATIISFPYSAGTTNQTSSTDPNASAPTAHALAVEARFVGATWGLAENTKTQTILASAFTKKHVGYGPNGPGAIYTMGTTGTTASLWVDLGTAAVGGNFRSGYTDNNDYFRDSGDIGWDAVGKTSFGGLAINDANTEVYVMNLANRRLYTIQVNADGSAGAITSILIPVPGNATGDTTGTNRGDLRPFAVEYHNGLVYVGMVNSAESTGVDSQLRGYVYTYNPATQAWSTRSVINESNAIDGFALNYNRATSYGGSDTFKAWRSTFGNVNGAFNTQTNNAVKYPQPILSGLSFDATGNLNIAIRDRAGDQLGNQVPSNPADPTYSSNVNTQLYLGISAGELLKAGTNNNGTFTLENNATAGGNTTGGISDNAGPGGGEFFFQDDYNFGTHTEVSSGAVANAPGFPDTISTVFDPIRFGGTKTAGIRWYSDANGVLSKSYQIYDDTTPGTFGKATGLGDLLVVLPPQGREIGNRVWNDTNANGRQDAGESGISGVQVILTFNGTAIATATTDANGEYYFSSNPGTSTPNKRFGLNLEQTGAYVIAIPVVQGPLAGLSVTTNDINVNAEDLRDSDFVLNANTNRAEFTLPALAAGQSDHTFDAGFRPPNNAQISGYVYQDNNNNGQYETGQGEPSISAVTVVLTGVDGANNSIAPRTTTTDGSGFYQFTGLIAGTYTVTETQPAAYLDGKDTAGSLGGSNAVNDVLSAIVLPASGNSQNNNFGELLPAALNGFVYLDANDDGIFQNTETPILGVTVVLTGTNDLGAIAPQTLTTTNAGFYSFTGLRPGTYTVTETQPAAFADGKDTAGTPGGGNATVNDVIAAVTLTQGLTSPNNNFGERPLAASSLSGFVYYDLNNDGTRAGPPGEPGIQSTTVVLTGTTTVGNVAVNRTTTTDSAGFYQFTGLQAGTYTVNETQPAAYLDGKDTAGSLGGTVTNDQIATIILPDSTASINNNFGELLPAAVNGFVYVDANNDGVFQNTETPIPGTTVVLTGTNDLGAIAPQTLTTSNTGFYSFTGLRPGTYTVTETQPAGFADGKDTPGTPGGGNATTNDVISAITLTPGLTSPNNNFGERQLAQLSGFVYRDTNNDGIRQLGQGETGITPTTVVLTGTVNGNAITPLTQTTDANGFYQFAALQPGTYTVTETQPAGFLDGKDTPGAPGGGSNAVNDVLSNIVLTPNDNSIENNFGELIPAALNGFVYLDANNDGVFQNTETPIPGVTVVLTGTNDLGAIAPQTLTTTNAGFYSFANLRPGSYRVAETQPAAYADGRDTPGTPGGGNAAVNDIISAITLTPGLTSPNNNFGERFLPGSLSGYVYRDPNVNGQRESALGETGIAGTKVVLYSEGPNGPVAVATAFTASDGFYQFRNLAPGNYRVAETQPLGFYDGLDTVGSTGGSNAFNDVLTAIPVLAGGNSVNNNFGEVQNVNLFGYVWIDSNRNGIYDPGEAPVPNAVVAISGTAFAGTPIANALNASQAPSGLSIVTDANGRYDFFRLPPGSYSLVQTNTPAGLTDFASQNAAPGLPIQLSSSTTFGGIGLNVAAPGPLNFGKVFENPTSPPPGGDPSKEAFLGSTLLGAVAPTGNPLVGAPTFAVNTTPTFRATNTTSIKPVYLAAGAGAGFSPVVRVFNYRTGVEINRFLAFDATFLGGVETATGDVNGDGTPDIIAAAGAGAGPHVKVFDGLTGAEIRSFFAYDPTFRGGVTVASGDVDGDGFDDIITGAMSAGAPHVKVFSGRTGQELQSFFAFDSAITTGVRVAAGDVDGDGKADIIASTGEGTPARVKAFQGTTLALLSDLSVFDGYRGGIYVSAGDFNGDGKADIVVGSGAGASRVSVYTAAGGELASFFADSSNASGVRVAVKDLNGDGIADIITGAGIGTASRITGFSGAGLGIIEDFDLFDSGVRTGVFVG